jgi:hypothetical protein
MSLIHPHIEVEQEQEQRHWLRTLFVGIAILLIIFVVAELIHWQTSGLGFGEHLRMLLEDLPFAGFRWT